MINFLPLIFQIFVVSSENIPIESESSFYGQQFHGRKTACKGCVFDMYAMTTASPNLPCGTKVKVINLANNKEVIVTVNDRGPFAVHRNGSLVRPLRPHPKRALDLSQAAFEKIADKKVGVIKIKYFIL
jgi:rare lipoprotein A